MLFGLGPWELAVTAGVVLVLVGPTFLPKLGRYVGRSIKELKESTESFSANLREEMEGDDEAHRQLSDGSPEELTEPVKAQRKDTHRAA